MRYNFNKLSRLEVDFLINNCNFSEEEGIIIKMASSSKCDIQISEKLNISVSTVKKRKKKISGKIISFLEVSADMTTIYVNGNRTTKEELKKMEIQIDRVKKILSEKLTKKK